MKKRSTWWGVLGLLVTVPAWAKEPGSTEAGSSAGQFDEDDADDTDARFRALPYAERYRPVGNLWEVGLFGGVFAPAYDHNLESEGTTREPYASTGVSVGARLAYFPLSFAGVEVEGMLNPTSTRTTESVALLYSFRAHAIAQLPLHSFVPFALVGGGILGASSQPMGHDADPLFHFGVGAKLPLSHILSARVDLRDNLTQANGRPDGTPTHNFEVLLGATFTFERPVPPRIDSDYDGVPDPRDACPHTSALTTDGCPTFRQLEGPNASSVRCEPLPEAAPRPVVPASAPPVLPPPPEAVEKFTGVVSGISFAVGRDTITRESYPALDEVYLLLVQYPDIRLEVSGHSSNEGKPLANRKLSLERANAVRAYLVKKGIADTRIVARGAGADEPIADNATQEGREQNRRIEFRVLGGP